MSRLGCAFLLTLIGVALIRSDSATAVTAPTPEMVVGASTKTIPAKLPRSRAIPITLRAGFTSEALKSPTTPEVSRIVVDISRGVKFQTTGLPSCPLKRLHSESAHQTCAKSLVGHGIVDSEITLPGKTPVMVQGDLSAFYAFEEGRPYILAQVTTGAPLPLIYVIPFQIAKADGTFGRSLVVRKMSNVQGQCRLRKSNCFEQPYTLKGIYGHISKLELSLHRAYAHAGERQDFLSARCPAVADERRATFSLLRVSLNYAGSLAAEGARSATVTRRC